jgi:hypothetical protein
MPRRVFHGQATLEHQVSEHPLAIRRRTARAQPARGQRLVDTPQVTDHAVQSLGGEAALIRAELALAAEAVGQPVGGEPPVDARSLPQVEHQLPEAASRGCVARELRLRFVHFRHEMPP